MSGSAPSYVVCPVCHVDRFLLSRRLYLLTLDSGEKQRNWASGENSSQEIVCASCHTRLRWNVESQSYVIIEKGTLS